MPTLTLLARPSTAAGGLVGANPTDVLIGSIHQSHPSTPLTLNAAATNVLLQVAGSTVLTVTATGTSTAIAVATTSMTTPRIDSTTGLILNAATANSVQISVNSTTVLTISSTGLSATQPLAMGSNKITGGATATAAGDMLVYPWLGGTNGSATLGSVFSLTGTTTTYQDIGLSVALPSAGTYEVTATVRGEISETTGAGAFITAKLFNSTDSTDIANSETFVAQANSLSLLVQNTVTIVMNITIAAAKTIKVYCMRTFSGAIITSDIPSDANGRSRIKYMKINDA